MLVRKEYGSQTQFLSKLNPSAQIIAARNPDRAFFGSAPSLVIMNKTYGEGFAATWLLPQIFDLVAYSNSNGTLKEPQAEFLAEAIANEYYYLKASELLLFFYRFKLGKYGQFYGVVDPMRVTMALEEFIKERNAAIARREQEQEKAERESWYQNSVPLREYCRSIGIPEQKSIEELMAYIWAKQEEEEKVNQPKTSEPNS